MSFVQDYNAALQRLSQRKVTLHLIGRVAVAISVGVFFAADLEQYAGLLLIGGIILMLPVLGEVLKEKGAKQRRSKKRRKR